MNANAVRRNYFAFLFEGGFFVFGMGFVSAQTLLPALILKEGGSGWLAAFVPTIMVIALFGVPLLNAGWVDTLNRLKPFVLLTGFFQRLIYPATALLLMGWEFPPAAVVALLALTPFLSGLFGGIGFSAWQRLYMEGVPPDRRASNLAYRFLFGGIGGIVAGIVIEQVLTIYPGPFGYGILHLIAGAFLMASLAILATVHEPSPPHPENETKSTGISYRQFLSQYYGAGPARKTRRSFAFGLFATHGIFILPPFYAVTLLDRLAQPDKFLGTLALAQMIGQSAGNLTAAWIGDQWGGRSTCAFGLITVAFTALPALFVDSVTPALVAYGAFYFGVMLTIVGKDTLLMELAPEKHRSRYLSIMAAITMIALVVSALVSKLLWSSPQGFSILVIGSILSVIAAFFFISKVKELRPIHLSPLRTIRRGILRLFR